MLKIEEIIQSLEGNDAKALERASSMLTPNVKVTNNQYEEIKDEDSNVHINYNVGNISIDSDEFKSDTSFENQSNNSNISQMNHQNNKEISNMQTPIKAKKTKRDTYTESRKILS